MRLPHIQQLEFFLFAFQVLVVQTSQKTLSTKNYTHSNCKIVHLLLQNILVPLLAALQIKLKRLYSALLREQSDQHPDVLHQSANKHRRNLFAHYVKYYHIKALLWQTTSKLLKQKVIRYLERGSNRFFDFGKIPNSSCHVHQKCPAWFKAPNTLGNIFP